MTLPVLRLIDYMKLSLLPGSFRESLCGKGRDGGYQFVLWLPQKNSATVPGPVWLPMVVPT